MYLILSIFLIEVHLKINNLIVIDCITISGQSRKIVQKPTLTWIKVLCRLFKQMNCVVCISCHFHSRAHVVYNYNSKAKSVLIFPMQSMRTASEKLENRGMNLCDITTLSS